MSSSANTGIHTGLQHIYHIFIIVKVGQAGKGMTMRDKPGDSVVNGLSSPAKTDNHTVLIIIKNFEFRNTRLVLVSKM